MKLIMKIEIEVDLFPETIEEVVKNRKDIDEQFKPENFKEIIKELIEDELGDDGEVKVIHAEARIEE